jgi:hypothetical protein
MPPSSLCQTSHNQQISSHQATQPYTSTLQSNSTLMDNLKHMPPENTMGGNDKTTGQTCKAKPKLPTLRRGAVSVQSSGEYQKLLPHENGKDKPLQYVDSADGKPETSGGNLTRSTQ